MSQFENISLEDVIPSLNEIYNSIDIRALILNENGDWKNIFTFIQFTRRTSADIKEEHKIIIEKIGSLDDEKVKIIMMAYNIEEFKNIYNQLKDGYINMGELKTYFIANTNKNYTIGKFSRWDLSGELSEYPNYGITFEDNEKLPLYYNRVRDATKKYGINDIYPLMNSWFSQKQFENRYNLKIIFPIYCKIINFDCKNNYEIYINIKIDKKLVEDTSIWINRLITDSNNIKKFLDRKNLKLSNIPNVIQNDFFYYDITLDYEEINSHNVFDITISNKKYGLLVEESQYMGRYGKKKENTLFYLFNQFEANEIFEKNIYESPKSQALFELSISWLLELLGYNTIYLSKDGEILKEDKIHKGSADIIAYNDISKFFYVIDCTISPPSSEKIDKIRNTAEYIARKNDMFVKPFIFCAQNCYAVKNDNKNVGVKIIDKEDIIKLYQIYKGIGYTNELKEIMGDEIPAKID